MCQLEELNPEHSDLPGRNLTRNLTARRWWRDYLIIYSSHEFVQGLAKVITLLENAITFANGAKCQFGFDICKVNKQKF